MENNKTLIWCDKLLVFFFCALVYFLPISIALVEWFSGLAITTFFVKRSVLFSLKRKALKESDTSTRFSFFEKVKYFLKAFKPVSTSLSLPVGVFLLINFLSILFSQYPSLRVSDNVTCMWAGR